MNGRKLHMFELISFSIVFIIFVRNFHFEGLVPYVCVPRLCLSSSIVRFGVLFFFFFFKFFIILWLLFGWIRWTSDLVILAWWSYCVIAWLHDSMATRSSVPMIFSLKYCSWHVSSLWEYGLRRRKRLYTDKLWKEACVLVFSIPSLRSSTSLH